MLLTGYTHSSRKQATQQNAPVHAACRQSLLTCAIVLHAVGMVGMKHGPRLFLTDMQGYKVEREVPVNVHAGASAHATGENAPLTVNEHKAKKSWWQKLSQSINLAGAWLFLQVLFVRLFLRIKVVSPHAACLAV